MLAALHDSEDKIKEALYAFTTLWMRQNESLMINLDDYISQTLENFEQSSKLI